MLLLNGLMPLRQYGLVTMLGVASAGSIIAM